MVVQTDLIRSIAGPLCVLTLQRAAQLLHIYR